MAIQSRRRHRYLSATIKYICICLLKNIINCSFQISSYNEFWIIILCLPFFYRGCFSLCTIWLICSNWSVWIYGRIVDFQYLWLYHLGKLCCLSEVEARSRVQITSVCTLYFAPEIILYYKCVLKKNLNVNSISSQSLVIPISQSILSECVSWNKTSHNATVNQK